MLSGLRRIINRKNIRTVPDSFEKRAGADAKPLNLKDYWENRLKDNFGLHGVGFIGLGKSYNKWMYRVRMKVFLSTVRSLHLDLTNREIMDIGCGTGFYIDLWKNKEKAGHLTGIDITNIAIQNLKAKFPDVRLYTADICNGTELQLKSNNNQFDIISAFDVLFHITDDSKFEQAIKNVHSMLKLNGYFIFSDNFIHGAEIRSTYQVSRSLSKIEKSLKDNGFEIIRRKPMFVLMNAPIDTTKPRIKRRWKAITLLLAKGETIGSILGCILYPIEIILVSILKESASTEIMTCRKIS
jgi:2-polyprenyl-3-methyl-5-hydroxy-6-metoxy-1,4-benzoquinol methylase